MKTFPILCICMSSASTAIVSMCICGHCARHLEGSCEFIGEWKQKIILFSRTSRSLILAHDFSKFVFWALHSIKCNCNANTMKAWRVFQADLHHANNTKCESTNIAFTQNGKKKLHLKTKTNQQNNPTERIGVSNEYYVLSNLGSAFLLSYIQVLIRMK